MVLGFWGLGSLGVWGFGDLLIWGFGDLGLWGSGHLGLDMMGSSPPGGPPPNRSENSCEVWALGCLWGI